MIDIQKLRNIEPKAIAIVSHPVILQAILDFDFISGKNEPSIVAILGTGKKFERYFFGKDEILIPVFSTFEQIPDNIKKSVNLFLSNASGRRTFLTSEKAVSFFPNLLGGVIFAENVPEKYSVELYKQAEKKGMFIVGPASVGIAIPGHLKLGAIAGTQAHQLIEASLFTQGNVAVFAASGGMTNEVISVLSQNNKYLSFALSFGGDRFPIASPKEALLAAQADKETEYIVYYGELGGYDEYEIEQLIKEKKVTKTVIAYIGGVISEMFETPPQFGHAKAMAEKGSETAQAKRKALKDVGVQVADSFDQFIEYIKKIKTENTMKKSDAETKLQEMQNRKQALFMSTISGEKNDEVELLGQDQLSFIENNSFASVVISMLLGKQIRSKELEQFTDLVLKMLIDNGPYQSGVINTMITARAGKDLVSSLVSGLLTVGPRFGGAVNGAASIWLNGVKESIDPFTFVEEYAKQRKFILGIGHKKYRSDFPDPRVKKLLAFTDNLKEKQFTNFALEIEKITTAKKGNLILNVDGTMAAVLLDLLHEKEGYSYEQLQELVEAEFFNALFVLSRSVGLTAHFLDQKRLDEGLFRLGPDEVKTVTK
jgi:succinyl-CoA synthetase alpha subunit